MSATTLTQAPGADTAPPAGTSIQQYLSFRCRGERYALPIRLVREIIEYGQLTPVPMMPAFIRGVINLRGNVVPVVDLSSRFGLGVTDRTQRTCVIILEMDDENHSREMGLVVESVEAVFDLDETAVEPAPRFGVGVRADFINAMARDDHGFLVLLELGSVLSVQDMRQIAEAGHLAGQGHLADDRAPTA